jgi:hypothetical protein
MLLNKMWLSKTVISFIYLFIGTEVWTQGLGCARQVLYSQPFMNIFMDLYG